MAQHPGGSPDSVESRAVRIMPTGLDGLLIVPVDARGLILFAHGSGSSRFSPRTTFVAGRLRAAGLATLMFDLLTEKESMDRRNVFDVDLLAERLIVASDWALGYPFPHALPCGYFGASTGAAAALVAAAQLPGRIAAVVSRGRRPDMAAGWLSRVDCPTLLIVGERDPEVLELNEIALGELRCERELRVVPGATHLFEEPGTLEVVVRHARDWFLHHMARGPR